MFSKTTTLNRKLIQKKDRWSMKTLNTATWHEQEMKLCLEFNYHYSQKKSPKSHMFIFQYRLIYILLMLCSSYNRALLGIDVEYKWSSHTNQKENTILWKQLAYQFENKWEPSKPSHCKNIHVCDTSTSHLVIEESQRNSKFPMIISEKLWCLPQMLKQFLLPPSKFCSDWQTKSFWIMYFS